MAGIVFLGRYAFFRAALYPASTFSDHEAFSGPCLTVDCSQRGLQTSADQITLVEVGPRDGLQNEQTQVNGSESYASIWAARL